MDQHDFAFRLARGALKAEQNLNLRLSADQQSFARPAAFAIGARPKISRDGGQVGITEERLEGAQIKL